MKKSENIWTERYAIRANEIDAHGVLSILALCNIMQETAGNHAHALGLSVQQLHSRNYTWVLSRLLLNMNSYPGWRDSLQVSTWHSGNQKLFALRDFLFTDKNDCIIGSAVTAWVVIDTQTRRPVRVEPFLEELNVEHTDRAMTNNPEKLPVLEKHEHEQRFSVRYSDLDVNRHVNNVSYIGWVNESIPAEIQNSSVLSELEINYLAETYFGDYIRSGCQPQNESRTSFLHSITREEDSREILRARTVWKPLK